jgi:hypothetical protein
MIQGLIQTHLVFKAGQKRQMAKTLLLNKYARWSIGAEQLMKEQIKR